MSFAFDVPLYAAALIKQRQARSCTCRHGTCRRCLVRRSHIAPSAAVLARSKRLALSANRQIDLAAEAFVSGHTMTGESHKAIAKAMLDAVVTGACRRCGELEPHCMCGGSR